jgi:hypothetical protein
MVQESYGDTLLVLEASFADGRLVRMHGLATGYRGIPLTAPPITLSQVLFAYDTPSAIRLNTPDATGDEQVYQLLLVYNERRFAADFLLVAGEPAQGNVCFGPSSTAEITLWTWASGYAAQPTADNWRWMGHPMDTVTGYDLDMFSAQVVTDGTFCLATR